MPVNRKKMNAMMKEYGAKKGKEVYYAMENKMKHESGMPRKMDTPMKRKRKTGGKKR